MSALQKQWRFDNWFCSFAGSIGVSTNLQTELLGILHGLELAWTIGACKVECRPDSQEALTLLRETHSPFHKYASIIQNIRELVSRQLMVKFQHTLPEGNRYEDFLARV